MRRAVALVLLAALLLAVYPLHAQDETTAAGPRFGVAGGPPDALRDLGAEWALVRFEWAALQAEPGGDLDRDALDVGALAALDESGIDVVGQITVTPAWASESGDPAAVPDGLALPVTDPGNYWAQFVAALVAEFAPLGVDRWLLYDQPDVQIGEGRVGFAGDAPDYARMLVAAQQAAGTQAIIQPGPLVGWADAAAGRDPYLGRLLGALSAAGRDYVPPAVTLRVTDSTARVWQQVSVTRAILDTAGLPDTAIWLLASAAPTLDPLGGEGATVFGMAHVPGASADPPLFGITLAQQADFVVQVAAIALALGVERFAITPLQEAEGALSGGLLRADGTRRPAFEAYQRVIALFGDVQGADAIRGEAIDLVALRTPAREIFVSWARGTVPVQITISAPEGEAGTLAGATGDDQSVTAGGDGWPPVYTLDAPPAQIDANGFLTVAGAPRVLVLERRDDFFRVIYAERGGAPRERLR